MSSHASSTLFPPPLPDFTCAPIEHPLLVSPVGCEDQGICTYTNTHPLWMPPPGRALFGGILIGQALRAAQQTAPPGFSITSMNCSFLAAPDASKPLFYRVERVSNGRSFASRLVKAEQAERVFFTAVCNFSLSPKGTANASLHQVEMPPVGKRDVHTLTAPHASAANERSLTEKMILPGFLTYAGPTTTRQDVDPFVWHDSGSMGTSETSPSTNLVYSWAHSRGKMSASRESHSAVLACLTDSWFLSSFHEVAPVATGAKAENIGFMVSLNHTIWFHDSDVRLDEWVLIEKGSSWAADGRCLMEQRIWGHNSKLVATCVQEGVVRLKKAQVAKKESQQSNDSKL